MTVQNDSGERLPRDEPHIIVWHRLGVVIVLSAVLALVVLGTGSEGGAGTVVAHESAHESTH